MPISTGHAATNQNKPIIQTKPEQTFGESELERTIDELDDPNKKLWDKAINYIFEIVKNNTDYKPQTLEESIKKIIDELDDPDTELSDLTVNHILEIVSNDTDYKPQTTFIYFPDTPCIPAEKDKNDIQILFNGRGLEYGLGHWICTFYNSNENKIYVYDSKDYRKLDTNQLFALFRLYPFLKDIKKHIIYNEPKVLQEDGVSCGVFALTYLLSLAIDIPPEQLINFLAIEKRYSHAEVIEFLRRLLKNIVIQGDLGILKCN